MLKNIVVLFITLFIWSAPAPAAQSGGFVAPIQHNTSAKVANPAALPLDIQLSQLREMVTQLQQKQLGLVEQLKATQRELADLRGRYARHSHIYGGIGKYVALNADALVPKGSLYHGRGMTILGRSGTPGNPVMQPTKTSGPND